MDGVDLDALDALLAAAVASHPSAMSSPTPEDMTYWRALIAASPALLAHVRALEQDAARYRWPRDPPGDWWNTYAICAQDEALFGDKADAAIDAARAAAKVTP